MSLVSGPGRAGMMAMPAEMHLFVDRHVRYIQSLDTRKDELEYWLTEHLRLNGLYWGLTALHLLGHPHALPRNEVLDFVFSCLHPDGGFGAAPGHDAHMLYTVSGVQILATLDAFAELDERIPGGRHKIGQFIANLQDPETGTFAGDEWGEQDTRFLYGALNALSLMGLLDLVDVAKAAQYVDSCANFDGGYGTTPGAESHAGQVFTCVAALTIAGRLDLVNHEKLGAWLSERQLKNGGLNGRPEKKEDVCYSWWVMSSMAMLDKLHWIDGAKLTSFILQCQDPELGGLADRPGDMVDVFHTVFGIAGLSLLKYPGLEEVDPVYCMPRSVTRRCLDPETQSGSIATVAASFVSAELSHVLCLLEQPPTNFFLLTKSLCLPPPSACECLPLFPASSTLPKRWARATAATGSHPCVESLMSRTPTATSPSPLRTRSFRIALHPLLRCSCVCFTYAPYKRQPPRCSLASAHRSLSRPSGMANIPLHCNICPKKPNFSDVSHLLTHIASKGHLSNYYKVKVRSTSEEASRQLIEAYDRWYAEWSVEELMSERMNQKDKRRTRQRPAARPTSAPKIEASEPRPTRRAAPGNFLDPRLSEQQQHTSIKLEQSPSPVSQSMGPVLRSRNTFAPRMQYWSTESRASSRSYTNPDYDTSSEYSEPSERRRPYRYPAASCAIEDDPADMADPMAVSESTKLKGVYWPGMDIFDSATPEMRRKRNQKKDISVVAQLELNSLDVEATELIFTPMGSFKRQRRISCSESDEEEVDIKSESSPLLRRRPALAHLDPNTSRRTKQSNRQALSFFGRTQYEQDHERAKNNNNRASKRKRFDVFQDDDNVAYSQPNNMTYLTSGFTRQPSPSPAPPFNSYKPFNDPFQYENKENILPSFHQATYGNVHSHQSTSYQYPVYSYGLGHDQHGFQFGGHLYNASNGYQQQGQDDDDDDQRTITAPPSPSTS